ncbi:hypothetical protein MO973_46665 [Paenibacillus sp. TRM 82003]|nr:hypothetical protein [Paenibacillus sp. TRM 82003]
MIRFHALLLYYHTSYLRSLRYAAPTLLYVGAVVWSYLISPNPVLSSYGFTSALLYAIGVWLACGYIDAEPGTQRALTALHAGGLARSVAAKLAYLMLFAAPIAIFAVAWPLLVGAFGRAATAEELGFALAGHLLLAWLGIGTGVFCGERLFPNRSYKLPALLLLVAVVLGAEGIRDALPGFAAPMLWLLPPARLVLGVFLGGEEGEFAGAATALSAALGYVVLQCASFVFLMKRRGV